MSRFAWTAFFPFVLALPGVAVAADLWQTDFEAAQVQAKTEKKLLLVSFTGSDWCGWCMRLKSEVFDQQAFKKAAPKRYVLVDLDFPKKTPLPEKLKTQNNKLAREYNIHGYPTVLMLDAEGKVIARTGYRAGGAEGYTKHLADLKQTHDSIAKMRADLSKLHGLPRATTMDKLIDAYEKLGLGCDDIDGWCKEIATIDARTKAGMLLKLKYQFRSLMTDAAKLTEDKKFDEAKAAVKKALAMPKLTGEQKQTAHFAGAECCIQEKDIPGAVAGLKQSLADAPESSKASEIESKLADLSKAGAAKDKAGSKK